MTSNLTKFGYDFFDDLGRSQSIVELGNRLGEVLEFATMPLVQTLTPRLKQNEPPNTYSGIFGCNAFPFHTDMAHWYRPPRYLVLRCSVPDEAVPTRVIKASRVIPSNEEVIAKRALFKPRRRLDGKSYLLRISQPGFYRWDSVFIEPANAVAVELAKSIKEKLLSSEFEEIRFSEEGQVLIIDNWLALHGRSPVTDLTSGRRLERVYLEKVCL